MILQPGAIGQSVERSLELEWISNQWIWCDPRLGTIDFRLPTFYTCAFRTFKSLVERTRLMNFQNVNKTQIEYNMHKGCWTFKFTVNNHQAIP